MKYFIKSKTNGKFLSTLIPTERFTAKDPIPGKAYYYEQKQIAEDIAAKLNASIFPVK